MYHKGYITFAQLNSFLKTQEQNAPEVACANAIRYLQSHGTLRTAPPLMAAGCDIITVSDEDFLSMCDELPIQPFLLEENIRLTSASLFPPNYECFVIRHMNSMRADVHHHDFFEICYVWQGSCTQSTAKQRYEMEPGDFFIIAPGTDHTVTVKDPDTVLFNIMVRKEAFLTSCFPLLSQNFAISSFLRHCLLQAEQETGLLIHAENTPVLKRIVKHLVQECYTLQELFCDFAINIFNQLFCYMLLFGEVKAKYLSLPDNFSLIAILHEIHHHYRTVTLRSLSEQFFFSEEHLSRLIKKTTGKTFSELLRETRINQAKILLERTDMNIEQISAFIGYSDASSFTKAFKADFGRSPAQYRKQRC